MAAKLVGKSRAGWVVWFLLCAAGVGACAAGPPVASEPDFSAINAAIEDEIANRRIPFGEVLIFRDGRMVHRYRSGHIDVAGRIPLPQDGLYRIASLSKPMTSFAALRLIEAGYFGLDDPVSKHLPELAKMYVREACAVPVADSGHCRRRAASQMTIRHLLAHTAGISYPLVDEDELSGQYRAAGLTNGAIETIYFLDALPARIASLPLANDPGMGWRYGLATDVLGNLMEVTTGMRLPEILDSFLFAPLGMRDTYFVVPASARNRLLPIFEYDLDGNPGIVGPGREIGGAFEFSSTYPLQGAPRYFSGGGGLVASAADLGAFARMLAAGGKIDGRPLLGPELFAEFRRDQTVPFGTGIQGTGFGLGIGVRLTESARGTQGHVGELFWSGIFFTTLWADTETGTAGVFLSQLRPDQRGTAARRVQNAAFDALNRIDDAVR